MERFRAPSADLVHNAAEPLEANLSQTGDLLGQVVAPVVPRWCRSSAPWPEADPEAAAAGRRWGAIPGRPGGHGCPWGAQSRRCPRREGSEAGIRHGGLLMRPPLPEKGSGELSQLPLASTKSPVSVT